MPKRWPNSTPEQRGKMAEERFFEAWEDQKYLPNWIVSIERPTMHEDIAQKTDAVIIRIHGPNLRIQIKSYWLHPDQRDALMKYGVIPLSIPIWVSLRRIRALTHIALKDFATFNVNLIEEYTTIPNKKNWHYYKKGKKYKSKYT